MEQLILIESFLDEMAKLDNKEKLKHAEDSGEYLESLFGIKKDKVS